MAREDASRGRARVVREKKPDSVDPIDVLLGAGPVRYTCTVYEDAPGEWRWRLVANNSRIVGVSGEGYTNRSHANVMAESIFGGAEHIDVHKAES